MTEDRLRQLLQEGTGFVPAIVVIFPSKSDRSSAGICEFETAEQAMEALVKCNHTPLDSPTGAYIFKLAFVRGHDCREFSQ